MKLRKSLFLFICILSLLPFTYVSAETSADNNWTFSVVNGTINNLAPATDAVRKGNVTIPSNIDGMPVKSIASDAFKDCYELTSVVIQPGIELIGGYAFSSCYSLTSVTLPSSIDIIGTAAFYYTTLTEITIPNNVGTVDEYAFGGSTIMKIQFNDPSTVIADNANTIREVATIYGYTGSTAEAYAIKYSRSFVSLGDSPETNTDVNVNADPTIIDVTITPVMNIQLGNQWSANDIHVTNNGMSPITVKTTGLVARSSSQYFKLVSADKYTNWNDLTKAESHDVAIALGATTGWLTKISTDWDTTTAGTIECTLGIGSTGVIRVTDVNHGNSFEANETSAFDLLWTISLVD